ncbi:MAG: ABC-2 family transporter protein [Candidatus Micrarchaeota archaeon]|nr:ABC-2 family transporter protein [Candidatus Micrarchaeota archaeon]
MIHQNTFGKYFVHARFIIKRRLAFKFDMALLFGLQIISPMIMLFVWSAVYLATQVNSINNFTLLQIATYFFVVAAVNSMAPDSSWGILSDIKTGGTFSVMTKPLSYLKSVVFAGSANFLFDALSIGAPILILLYIFTGTVLSASSFALFLLALIVAFALGMMFNIILGYLAFFIVETAGVINIYYFTIDFFGGWLVPLNLFPQYISSVTSVLPFQFLYYFPAAIFSHAISNAQAIALLWVAAFWLVVIGILTWGVVFAAKKHVDAVGV